MPLNPTNATETIEAAIKVDGIPLKAFGTSATCKRSLTPTKIISANPNPRPAPKALNTDSIKLYVLSIFKIVTPKTAQLVVIRGRYTPSELYSGFT